MGFGISWWPFLSPSFLKLGPLLLSSTLYCLTATFKEFLPPDPGGEGAQCVMKAGRILFSLPGMAIVNFHNRFYSVMELQHFKKGQGKTRCAAGNNHKKIPEMEGKGPYSTAHVDGKEPQRRAYQVLFGRECPSRQLKETEEYLDRPRRIAKYRT